jgi:hypothetical protein
MSRRAASVRPAGVPGVPAIFLAFAIFVGAMGGARTARAQFTDTGLDARKTTPEMDARSVRSGLVVGLMLGFGAAQTHGYPNNQSQIGDPAYYSSSDVMAGSSSALFLGGAISDYFNFGFLFLSQSYKSTNWTGKNSGGGFRLETFPLVYAVPKLKNVGLFAQFGIGSSTLDVNKPNYPEAKGVQSLLGIGAMWEFPIFRLFGGHGVLGPTIEYDAVYSQPLSSGAGVLGVRLAFYGGM